MNYRWDDKLLKLGVFLYVVNDQNVNNWLHMLSPQLDRVGMLTQGHCITTFVYLPGTGEVEIRQGIIGETSENIQPIVLNAFEVAQLRQDMCDRTYQAERWS